MIYYNIYGASQVMLVLKNPLANAGNEGLISGSGKSPGGENGTLLKFSCLENSMHSGALRL